MKKEFDEIMHKLGGSINPMVSLGKIFRYWLEKQDKGQLKEIDLYSEMCSQADTLGVRIKEFYERLDAWADKHLSKTITG